MRLNDASVTIRILKLHRDKLSMHQFKTLKGQAIAGDCEGALKGLHKIIKRKERAT